MIRERCRWRHTAEQRRVRSVHEHALPRRAFCSPLPLGERSASAASRVRGIFDRVRGPLTPTLSPQGRGSASVDCARSAVDRIPKRSSLLSLLGRHTSAPAAPRVAAGSWGGIPRGKKRGEWRAVGRYHFGVCTHPYGADAWRRPARHRGVLIPAPGRAFDEDLRKPPRRQPAPGRGS